MLDQPDEISMPRLLRTVVWRNLNLPGMEYFSLSETKDGYLFDGILILSLQDQPLRIQYQITSDHAWQTQAVDVQALFGVAWHGMNIVVGEELRWWVDGYEMSRLKGCVDIDLSFSPSTNTLPIRRLDLPVGAGQTVTAAWLRFPELEVQPLHQKYTRLDQNLYRYESRNGSFAADIQVDDLGLVVVYPGGWERASFADGETGETN
jgi:hypothetical protein